MKHRTMIRTGIMAAGLMAALGAPAASAQDFNPFAFLFGGQQQAQPRYEGRSVYAARTPDYERSNLPGYAPRYRLREEGTLDPMDPRLQRAMRRHREHARPKPAHATKPLASEKTRSDGAIVRVEPDRPDPNGKQIAIAPTKDAPQGSLALFAKDKTLRAGDVVVTGKGFMVYTGHRGATASRSSFVALNGAREVSDKNTLLALEKASRPAPSNVTVETVVLKEQYGPNLPAEAALKSASAAPVTKTR